MMEQIVRTVRDLEGALVVAPTRGDTIFPELAWGDAFFYYAPDGQMPRTVQPYGTIVTKNYPDDTASDLDPAGRWRVNVHVDRATFHELTAHLDGTGEIDPATPDVVLPHPVYATAGWVSVINPARGTAHTVLSLLHDAHDTARVRHERRRASGR